MCITKSKKYRVRKASRGCEARNKYLSNNGLEVNLLDDLNWPHIYYQLINILLFMITFYLRIVRK